MSVGDTSQPTTSELAKLIAEGIAEGMQRVAPKKVPFGRFDPKTPFHPDRKTTPRLLKTCFQNGRRMQAEFLHDEEIRLLNRITRPGRYIERRVQVVIRDEGGDDQYLDLQYKDGRLDTRFENKSYWLDMKEMLAKIVKEQDEILAVEEEQKSRKRTA